MSTPAPIVRARRIAGALLIAAFVAIVIALVLALNGWFTRTPTLAPIFRDLAGRGLAADRGAVGR